MAQGTHEESHRLGKTYFEPDASPYHRIEHSVKLLLCAVQDILYTFHSMDTVSILIFLNM